MIVPAAMPDEMCVPSAGRYVCPTKCVCPMPAVTNIPKHSTSHYTFNKPLHIRQATTHPTSYHTFNKLLHIPQASAHSTSLLPHFPSRFPPRHLEASRLGGCRNLGSESARGWNHVVHLQLSFPFSSPQFQAGFAGICHNRNTLRNT